MLSGFDEIKVCTAYTSAKDEDFRTEIFPYHQSVLHRSVGEYTTLPGWQEDLTGVRSWGELPQSAQDYLAYVEEAVGVPVVMAGVGPSREQIIWSPKSSDSAMAGAVMAGAAA